VIRRILATCLVVAPVLFAATEFPRLLVDAGAETSAESLAAIAQGRTTWELFGWLVGLTAPVWLAAIIGLAVSLHIRRPTWAALGGSFALLGALAWAMHQTSYAELNAVAAHHRDAGDVAVSVVNGAGGTGLEDATLIGMVVGLLLGPLLILLGHARAGLVPWWAFACVPIWVVVTALASSLSPTFALANLLLLPPFAFAARVLLSPIEQASPQRDPVLA